MRSRNIKPGFFKYEFLADLTVETRLLFIGLWCLADREGRLEDRPKKIMAELFPFDRFDIDSMLSQLQSEGFLLRYEVGSTKYIQVVNFVKHQDPHYKEKGSEIPPPHGHENVIKATGITRSQRERILNRDNYTCQQCSSREHLCIDHILPISRGGDSSDENLQVLCLPCNTKKGNKINGELKNKKKNSSGFSQEYGVNSIQGRINVGLKQAAIDPLIPDSLIPDSLIQETNIVSSVPEEDDQCVSKKTEDQPEEQTPSRNNYPQDFLTFFQAYPKTEGSKKKAYAAWKKARDKPSLEQLLLLIEKCKQSERWQRNIIPHPETWLNQARWETVEVETPAVTDVFKPKEFDPRTIYGDDFEYPKTATTKH